MTWRKKWEKDRDKVNFCVKCRCMKSKRHFQGIYHFMQMANTVGINDEIGSRSFPYLNGSGAKIAFFDTCQPDL
ncbi:hypothetical protein [Dyadobacter sp. CY356]|uniref:hypothetical protein n=1 Tax=Dyadobacter sp. CY356 TaxID=2906442 RepID=UPI00286DB6FD|nr:hypothetical protein [Dyadobacter sp. CY356]